MNRKDIIKKAGTMVIVHYLEENTECFAIGWLYAMEINTIKLKVTSTKYETFENILVDLSTISKIDTYQYE